MFDEHVEKYFPRDKKPTEYAKASASGGWHQKLSGASDLSKLISADKVKVNQVLGLGLFRDVKTLKELEYLAGLTSPDRPTAKPPDRSKDDYALASKLKEGGVSNDGIEIVLRTYRYRKKFDELRGSQRYLESTINKCTAISAAPQTQDLPTISDLVSELSSPPELTQSRAMIRESKLPRAAGLVEILSEPPPPRDLVRLGMVLAKVYVEAGFGGAGKSMHSLQTALEVCIGKTLAGEVVKQGAAMGVFGEDDPQESTRRISAVVKQFGLEHYIPVIRKYLRMFSMVGGDMRLTAPMGGALAATKFVEDIINAAHELREESGLPVRLIVLDHLGLLHGGSFNEREDAAITMRVINYIAQETGAAVLVLAHSPKSEAASEESTAQGVAGSTAFVDMARGAFLVAPMRKLEAKKYGIDEESRKDYVSVTTVKNNYGPSGGTDWYFRSPVVGYGMSVLSPVTLKPYVKTQAPSKNLEAKIIELVNAYRGGLSRTKIRNFYSGKEGVLGASKNEIVQCIDLMIASGKLVTRVPSQDERKTHDLSQQITQVLDTTGD